MAEPPPGVITMYTRVVCARCMFDYRSDSLNKSRLAAQLRQHGWSHTNEEGWVCNACLVRERAEKVRALGWGQRRRV